MIAYYLKLLGEAEVRCRVEPGRTLVIGRDPAADIPLSGDFQVSKRHVEVELRGSSLLIHAVGVGATLLNGATIRESASAGPGDQLQIGSFFVLVEEGVAEPEPETRPAPPPEPEPQPEPEAETAPRAATPRRAAAHVPPAAASGSVAGYDILEPIAESRTGRTFHARSRATGEEVAIKVLARDQAKNAAIVERFSREARALQRLDHPNVLKVREVGSEGGVHYCVMEHVPGAVTLAARLKEGPLGPRPALVVALQIANALVLAHGEEIVHRDVSPSSILVARNGISKLFNFSFVKLSPDEAAKEKQLTGLGDVIGDVTYCSPEQLADPRQVDARTDIYALGASLFHAVAGRPPFVGGSSLEIFRLVFKSPAPRLSEVLPDVNPRLDAVVAKLLARDVAARCQTAEEASGALKQALAAFTLPAAAGAPAAPAPGEAGGTALGGGYSGLELVEILQFMEFNRKHGALLVTSRRLAGAVHFRDGEIVGATAGALSGEEAVMALLATPSGTFKFRAAAPGDTPPGKPIRLRPSVIAVEAMRKRDEAVAG